MDHELKYLLDKIMAISPDVDNFIGAGAEGGHSSSDQMVYELRKAAITFAKAFRDPQTPTDELKRMAAQVEGGLLAVATILRFRPVYTDDLVERLHGLVRARSSQPKAGL